MMIKRAALGFVVLFSFFLLCPFYSCAKTEERKPDNFFIVLTDNYHHAYKIEQNTPYEEGGSNDLIEHVNSYAYETKEGAWLAFQVYGPFNSDGTKMNETFYQPVWDVAESAPISLNEEGDYTVSHSYYINGIDENGSLYHAYTAVFEFKIFVREDN